MTAPRGRPRLSADEKARRGTLRPVREREYSAASTAVVDPGPKVPEPLVPARDYLRIASDYATRVLAGEIVAGRLVRLACRRQQRDLERAAQGNGWAFVWDADEAIAAAHFIENCPHVEGRWSTPLIVLEPWQVFAVTTFFGWRYRDDRTRRRFTTFYLEVGRKSAKSTLAAAMALYHVLREGELGASVVCAATTGAQARVVFQIMQKMGRRSFWLRQQGLEVFANAIVAPEGSVKPINAKANSQDGLNPSCIVLDEAHAQDFALHDVLKSAQGARANPMLLCPTTAGYDLLSVGYALHQQLEKVLEGIFEADHLFGTIYAIDEADDWRDPRVWIKANPMLGISPKLDYVERYCADAQQAPGLEGEFRVKICCVWAASAKAWLSMSAWDRCADPKLRIEDFLGKDCWIGGDLAQLDDLAALAYLFERGDELVAFVTAYLPEGVVDARARTVPAYRLWVETGLLITTQGSMIDLDRIEADVRVAATRFRLRRGVFDQWGAPQLVSRLAADGLPVFVEAKNAKTMTPPARELERRHLHGKIKHDGNNLLKWAASNAVVRRGVDDTLLPKKVSPESPNKIDPIDALLNAIIARLSPGAPKPKDYQLLVVGGGAR